MNRKTKVVFIALILIAVIVAGFSLNYIWTRNTTGPQGSPQGANSQKTVLKVSGRVSNGFWSRDNLTDLPDYTSYAGYSVSNEGNIGATNVMVTVTLNGQQLRNDTITSLAIYDEKTCYLQISTPYDHTSSVQIQASCQDSIDSYTLAVGSTFPRSWYVEGATPTVELFITPREQNSAAMKDNILKNKFFLNPDWIAVREWVGNNIKYNYAALETSTSHWQFPKETLQSGTGVCIDYSILLCSLYRDGVFSPNDVYVVVGMNGKEGHAWVKVNLPVLGWYTLESQINGSGWIAILGDLMTVSGYHALYEFNDQQFHTVG